MCVLFLCLTGMMSTTTYGQNTAVEIDENELGMGILFDMVNIFTGDVLHKKRISESFLSKYLNVGLHVIIYNFKC